MTSTSVISASSAASSFSSGGLTVTLTASPSDTIVGSSVEFSLNAQESHAPGALEYQVAYGDGSTDHNTAPQYCKSGPGQAAGQTWHLAHAFATPGTYRVMARVVANCTPDRATAAVTITVSPG